MTKKIIITSIASSILASIFYGCNSSSRANETVAPAPASQNLSCVPTIETITNTIYQYITPPRSYKYAYLGVVYDINISSFPHTIQKDYDINITFYDENQTFSSPLYTAILDKNTTEKSLLFWKLQISNKPFNFIENNNGRILAYEEIYFLNKKAEKILRNNFITPKTYEEYIAEKLNNPYAVRSNLAYIGDIPLNNNIYLLVNNGIVPASTMVINQALDRYFFEITHADLDNGAEGLYQNSYSTVDNFNLKVSKFREFGSVEYNSTQECLNLTPGDIMCM